MEIKIEKKGMNMYELTKEQYQKIGKDFLDFYMENGFGNKSKKEIDLKIFLLLSKSFKGKKPISLARELGITVTKLKNLIIQTRLIKQVNIAEEKKELLETLIQTKWSFSEGFAKFTLDDPFVKMNFQSYCEDCNVLYDTSFNRNVIKISVKDLAEVIVNIAKIDEKTNLKIGNKVLAAMNKEELKMATIEMFNGLTTHYTGVSFSKIPDIFGSLLEQLKNKIKKD